MTRAEQERFAARFADYREARWARCLLGDKRVLCCWQRLLLGAVSLAVAAQRAAWVSPPALLARHKQLPLPFALPWVLAGTQCWGGGTPTPHAS